MTTRFGLRRPPALALAALAVAVAGLAACSAGQLTQTANQVPAVQGANANAGPNGEIALRDLVVVYPGPQGYPQGGNAPLAVRIFNDGATPVRLVRVTAGDAASSVLLVGGAAPTTAPPPPSETPAATVSAQPPVATEAPTGTPPASPDASLTPLAPPTPTALPAPPGQVAISIEIAPGSYVLLVPEQGEYLQLTGLTRPLGSGQSVALTFAFDNGASVLVNVPVTVPVVPVPRGSAEVHEEE